MYSSQSGTRFYNKYLGPFKVIEAYGDNAYKVHITALSSKRPTADKTFNVTSLKKYNAKVNDFERPPPTSMDEILQNPEQVVHIKKATSDSVTLQWRGSTFPVVITLDQYKRFNRSTRAFLEKLYNFRNPGGTAFHTPRADASNTSSTDISEEPRQQTV
ncbi:hypothetical protein JCM33374_g4915 [Metschnikowia sp. JCM 33374]|nr:hypothetical protein JCM33374_g4915 [Metschnikowia sp. JCM 33374]